MFNATVKQAKQSQAKPVVFGGYLNEEKKMMGGAWGEELGLLSVFSLFRWWLFNPE